MITSKACSEQRMTDWDLLLTDARIATMRVGGTEYGVIDDGVICIADGSLAWVGAKSEMPDGNAGETRSLGRKWVTPALIDCHTHVVFGGDRAHEFEQRLQGVSYEQIARSGGGILSTVNATRAARHDELFERSMPRVLALVASGAATIEIKSGYGLDVDTEIRMLEVARRIGESAGITVRTTLLAAHTIPPEYADNADAYIDLICNELIPHVAESKLADAVDAYCETIAFDSHQISKLFDSAKTAGLPVKLHADQLSDGDGARLAAKFGALSADHLEHTSSAGVDALAQAGCVAVLLPGAFLTLNETHQPPVDRLRQRSVPIAVATDCNPGTSPMKSLTEAMALACRLFGMTPEECLAGTTREAARALGLDDRGMVLAGMRADLAIWDIGHPRDLSYWLGATPLANLFISGRSVNLN
jgi:imidazolonepropionase